MDTSVFEKSTGCIVLHDTVEFPHARSIKEQWESWCNMPDHLKKLSDQYSVRLFGKTNQQRYGELLKEEIQQQSMYNGFPFIIHRHNPRHGSEHYDLRFLDLKNKKLLYSFALPDNWMNNVNKTVLFKTRDHDPRWLQLESYRLTDIDNGTVDYKMYRPHGYFVLDFHGKILNGTYQLFKLRDKIRKDVWMLVKKR